MKDFVTTGCLLDADFRLSRDPLGVNQKHILAVISFQRNEMRIQNNTVMILFNLLINFNEFFYEFSVI